MAWYFTAFDGNQVANTLIPKVNGGTTATQNGITISGLSVLANGNVMANVSATCLATNTTFSISVTDNFNKIATATLTVNIIPGPSITTQPLSKNACDATQTTFPIVVAGLGQTYQWKFSTDNGTTFNNVPNASPYSGTTSDTLRVLPNSTLNGYKYKCLITGACSNVETNIVTLNVQTGLLTLSGNVVGGTIQAYNATQINSVQNMPATTQIEYNAGKTMLLSPGFQANSQSFFRASIIGCN